MFRFLKKLIKFPMFLIITIYLYFAYLHSPIAIAEYMVAMIDRMFNDKYRRLKIVVGIEDSILKVVANNTGGETIVKKAN